MLKVYQTRTGATGNCFEACIASILDKDITDVPDLCAHEKSGKWIEVLNCWLDQFGMAYMECSVPTAEVEEFFKNKDFYHIIIAQTTGPGTIKHAVVGRKGKVIFDPLQPPLTIVTEEVLTMGVLVCTCLPVRQGSLHGQSDTE
jgi:hypothetical protein